MSSPLDNDACLRTVAHVQQIAFLGLSQAHQFLHWLPAALRLAREPDVEVTVLSASAAGLDLIRSYDPNGSLRLRRLRVPSFRGDGLFSPPKRRLTLLAHYRAIASYPVIVTTETTSTLLYRLPGFASRVIHLKHGAGDREGGYNPKHAQFDLTLVNGPKDKERLIARGLANERNCLVVGYAKFELVPTESGAAGSQPPMALYNPHFDKTVSSWFRHGPRVVRVMENIAGWNFVVAPHVKLKGGPKLETEAAHVSIDTGSVRSINMSYTEEANVYIGDVSSQVYEFLRRPRPCIFLNFDGIDWQGNENYAHWHLGQVIDHPEDLEAALGRASEVQPQFEEAQREAFNRAVDPSPEPASQRQARAIFEFARLSNVQIAERHGVRP